MEPKTPNAPDKIIVEFLAPNGEPVRLIDLGIDFLNSMGIQHNEADRPFRIGVNKRESKAGNSYYEYNQNSLPLPDKMSTLIRLEGAILPLGRIQTSKSGHPMREGSADIVVGGVIYTATGYISESKSPYYVKIIAHKKPEQTGLKKAQLAPKGGSII